MFHNSFHIFRKDRLDRTGDGILIAISPVFPSYPFGFPTAPDVEFLVHRVYIRNDHLYLTHPYIIPSADISTYKKHAVLFCVYLAQKSKPADMIITLGTFIVHK